VNRAVELTKQLKVDSVPMIIVDGKYKVAARDTALQTVDYLVERQKSES
jgi:predicted DsbA family dithiol-disulfide isomerase